MNNKTLKSLGERAEEIRNERNPRDNTAERVGGLLVDIVDNLNPKIPTYVSYDIIPTPSVLQFGVDSKTNKYIPDNLSVNCVVEKRKGDNVTIYRSDPNTGKIIVDDYHLYYRTVVGGALSNYTEYTGTINVASGEDSSSPVTSVNFYLAASASGTDITGLVKQVNVPVIRNGKAGKPGQKGEDVVRIVQDNPMDGIPCNSSGITTIPVSINTSVKLYKGTKILLDTTIQSGDVGSIAGIAGTITSELGVFNITWNIPVNTILENASYQVPIKITYNGVKYTTTFIVNAVKAGADGKTPVIKNLSSNPNQVVFRSGEETVVKYVDLQIKCVEGTTVSYTDVENSNLWVRYSFNSMPESYKKGTAWPTKTDYPQGVPVLSTRGKNLYIAAFSWADNSLVDNHTVAILCDGKKGEKGDTGEQGPQGEQGERGESGNSIYMDLDNEYDSILYDGANNKVGSAVSTKVYIYNNGTDVSNEISRVRIVDRNNVSENEVSILGRDITVSGLSDDGYVLIGATYNNIEYTSKFSIKKLSGRDKFELSINPNAIAVNTNDTQSNRVISVQVFRTPANSNSRELVSFEWDGNYEFINNYNLDLQLVDTKNNPLTETSRTDIPITTRTFILSAAQASDTEVVNVGATLDRNISASWETEDYETIPIARVSNGRDGTGANAVRLDLTNEMDTIPVDSTRTTLQDVVLTTTAYLYEGATRVNIEQSDISSIGVIAMNGGQDIYPGVPSISEGALTVTWTIPSGKLVDIDKTTVSIVIRKDTQTYQAALAIATMKSGAPGVSPTVINLLPSPSQVVFKRNSSGNLTPTQQNISLKVRINDETFSMGDNDFPSDLIVRYSPNSSPAQATDGNPWPGDWSDYTLPVKNITTSAYIYITAFKNGRIVDRESIPIIKDGVDGAQGPQGPQGPKGDAGSVGRYYYYAGDWSTVAFRSLDVDDKKSPYVLYDTKYYMCLALTKDDHIYDDNPSINPFWEEMPELNYVISKAVFSDYARLGSSIISGDWMMSQHGVMYDTQGIEHPITSSSTTEGAEGTYYYGGIIYNTENSYEKFDPQFPNSSKYDEINFVPNYAVNLLTGATYQ